MSSDFTEFLHILNPENTGLFNRVLAHAIGLNEAIVFSALVAKCAFYKSRNLLDECGCFYATADDIQESTCLTRRQQEGVISNLIKTGLIDVKVKGMPAKRYFKVFCNPDLLKQLLQSGIKKLEEIKEKASSSFNKMSKQDSTKSRNKFQQNVETSFDKMSKHDSTKSENMFQQNVEENISYKHKLKNISYKHKLENISQVSENLTSPFLPVPTEKDLPPPTKPPTKREQIVSVFDYWKLVMNTPRAVLDEKRKRRIELALKHYAVDNLKKAIDGCAASDWHMGVNSRGMKYNGVDLIFRDSENIERFMGFADKPPDTGKSLSIEEISARNRERIFGSQEEPYTINA